MTNRERENAMLSFLKPQSRGPVEETFHPWMLTVERFAQEGLPKEIADKVMDMENDRNAPHSDLEKYMNAAWGEAILNYEKHLGFDPVRRISFSLPIGVEGITCQDDWKRLKEQGNRALLEYYTDENIKNTYSPLKEEHQKGYYSIRMNIEGFFWVPRELLGIEPHMYAFYDMPELIHDINTYILDVYIKKLAKVLEIVPADVVYIMEDLSGKNGPMISPELFDEFVGSYYKRLIPIIKSKGVGHVFVDTDGNFKKLIPNFIKAGVDGFLPMDVNAGMDIVNVRQEYPTLKFIGGFNKLCIAEGQEAIDREFDRIMPVIMQGGYIPGTDHQVPPSVSLDNYLYYIGRLKEAMQMAGKGIKL